MSFDQRSKLILRQILGDKQQSYKEDTLKLVSRLCTRELQDPSQIDEEDKQATTNYLLAFQHFDKFFCDAYNQEPLPDSGSTADRPSRQLEVDVAADDKPVQAGALTIREREHCFVSMASATTWLVRGVIRLSENVGREAQGQVMDFLGDAMPALREGLELNRVEREVVNRSSRLLAPDAEVVKSRQVLGKRKAELEDMK